MQKLENFMNWLSDKDRAWWPLVSMRPPKNTNIDDFLLLKITCFFGPATAVLMFIPSIGMLEAVTLKLIVIVMALACSGFFVGYKLTFAYFWNRRARRLRADAMRTTSKVSEGCWPMTARGM
jgi:hypothetical protein